MKKILEFYKKWDDKNSESQLWQFVKFNIVSSSISILQLLLANILPLIFDSFRVPLPSFLQPLFDPEVLFTGESRYVVDGAVTWGPDAIHALYRMESVEYNAGIYMNMRALGIDRPLTELQIDELLALRPSWGVTAGGRPKGRE